MAGAAMQRRRTNDVRSSSSRAGTTQCIAPWILTVCRQHSTSGWQTLPGNMCRYALPSEWSSIQYSPRHGVAQHSGKLTLRRELPSLQSSSIVLISGEAPWLLSRSNYVSPRLCSALRSPTSLAAGAT